MDANAVSVVAANSVMDFMGFWGFRVCFLGLAQQAGKIQLILDYPIEFFGRGNQEIEGNGGNSDF